MSGYEVGSAYLSILPSADGFARNLSRELDGPFSQAGRRGGQQIGDGVDRGGRAGIAAAGGTLGRVFVGAFAAIGAAEIVSSAVSWLGEAVTAASDLAETQAKAGEIFGDSLGDVEAFAQDATRNILLSNRAAIDAAATFGIFGQSAGLAGDDLAGFSTDMVALASDLASFGNTDTDTAIQAIGAALRGESEPIRQYGVLLDDATLKARALTLGIYDGTAALTPQQRVLAAQAEILAQTSIQQGDAARTADGLANQQRILQRDLENVKTEIGTALLPVMTDLFRMVSAEGVPILKDLAAWFTENQDEVRSFVVASADGSLLFLEVMIRMGQAGAMFGDGIITVFDTVTRGMFAFVGAILEGAERAFGWIPGIGPKITQANDEFNRLRGEATSVMDAVRASADRITNSLGDAAGAVGTFRQAIRNLDGVTARVAITANGVPVNSLGDGSFRVGTAAISGRASGGPVVAGTPYIVGEREPELFVPDRSGVIYNQDQLAAMAGNTGPRPAGVSIGNVYVTDVDELVRVQRRHAADALYASGVVG